jgi:histidyl-tRNA synthetase
MTKPTLPQGTRDFGPDVVRKRNYILQAIKTVFELYGFQPLETPAMENLETLMGKYGDEGDKLIFKILNNGLDNPEKETKIRADFENLLKGKNEKGITERALKYDLTIPFARYVAMNHQQLFFPFKRYQVQPVWRADRPQKGRYREFFQCDADVVGSHSLLNEVDLILIYHEVFQRLKIKDYELRINHRKILAALAKQSGGEDKMTDISVAIDKLDKIGMDKVKEELRSKSISEDAITTIEKYLQVTGSNEEILDSLNELLGNNDSLNKAISDLRFIFEKIKSVSLNQKINIKLDPTLARGLNYYTGVIFEVKAPEQVKMGSIGGGGRYDDLTGLFGVPNIPGVGISFGVDRIYDVMEELNLFPENVHTGTQVLFFNLGEAESDKAFQLMNELRANGIAAELFHEQAKFDKQFKFAEKKNIPYIIILGEKELMENTLNIKELKTGVQQTIATSDILKFFKN